MKTKFDDDNLWKKKLTPQQFEITRRGGTERPFTGLYLNNKDDGIYSCICCGAKLFDSNTKFNSHSGTGFYMCKIHKFSIHLGFVVAHLDRS